MMTGISFKDIPFNVLVEIVSFCRSQTQRGCDGTRDICELSLVCRAFNDACSLFLFHTFSLGFLTAVPQSSVDLSREKISVINRKAPYIRELEVGFGCITVPKELMQDLISAMRCAVGIVSLKISNPFTIEGVRLPEELLALLASRTIKPKVLKLRGPWALLERAEIIKVEELHISPATSDNLALTTVIKASNLCLLRHGVRDVATFKPTPDDVHLKRIYIDLPVFEAFVNRMHEGKLDHIFNFTQVPFAEVEVQIAMPSALYSDWMERRHIAEKIFADDLTAFNVKFDRNTPGHATCSVWRSKNERVIHQDHLVDEKRDAEGLARDKEYGEEDSDSDYEYRRVPPRRFTRILRLG